MRNRKSIDALSGLVLLSAAAIAVFSVWSLPPKVDSRVHAELGRRVAAEALKVLGPGGEISIIARDTKASPQPAMDVAVKAFQDEVVRAGAKVSTRLIQLDPLRPVEVPPGDFFEVIRRAKPGQVIVSFLGPPVLDSEQRKKLSPAKPKIVALCTGNLAEQTSLRELFREGLLSAAIVNKPGPASPAGSSFADLYAVVEGESLSGLVSQVK